MKIERLSKRKNVLGEGPHWDARSATLLYDDAHGYEIVRFDPETKTETEVIRLGIVAQSFSFLLIDSIRLQQYVRRSHCKTELHMRQARYLLFSILRCA